MTSHLRQFLKSGSDSRSRYSMPRVRSSLQMAILLAESGFLTESEKLLTQLEMLPVSESGTHWDRGLRES